MIAPNALAIRAAGDVDNVSWTANCEFERDPGRAGLYVISVAASSKCTVYASATGEGKVTVQVLKK